MCRPLCCNPPAITDERSEACADVAAALVDAMERWDAKRAGTYFGSGDVAGKGVMTDMLKILAAISDGQRMEWLVTHVITDPSHYDRARRC